MLAYLKAIPRAVGARKIRSSIELACSAYHLLCKNNSKNQDPCPFLQTMSQNSFKNRRSMYTIAKRQYSTDSNEHTQRIHPSNYTRPPLLQSISQYLLWTPCLILSTALALILKPFPQIQYAAVTKLLLGSTKKIFNIEIEVKHHNKQYNNGPYLFCILNQNSLLEMIIYYAAVPVPVKLIQNIEFTAIPFFGWTSGLLGSTTIIRQYKEQAHRAMKKVAEKMRRNGDNFVVSVEGRRSVDGQLSPYKKGPAIVAIEAQSRIVPVSIENARDILPMGEWRIKGGKVIVTFHEAIDTRSKTLNDRDDVTEQLIRIAIKTLFGK